MGACCPAKVRLLQGQNMQPQVSLKLQPTCSPEPHVLHPTGSCPVPAFSPIPPPAHLAFPSALCHSAPLDQIPFSHHAGDAPFTTKSCGRLGEPAAPWEQYLHIQPKRGSHRVLSPTSPIQQRRAAGFAPHGFAMHLLAPAALSSWSSLPFKLLLQEPQCTFKTSPITSPFSWVLHSSSLASWSSSREIFPCRISIFSSEHFWGQRQD